MANLTLEPTRQMLWRELESFASTLRDQGHEVELVPPMEERGGLPPDFPYQLVIVLVGVVGTKEYDNIKAGLRAWFKTRPSRRQKSPPLQVEVQNERQEVFDQFTLEGEEDEE
jgi:hypothetical protein